ncbi:outer membrane protein [Taklimakanibacter deserti]|uniref:outer membrane protein n=1 Tax=Taklimakanibacter deserti TaxID=2267839 RepID=UPI000E65B9C8
MTKFLLRLTLCTAALAAVTTTVANAADYEPPPPPADFWTGPYIGGFIMGVGVESHYDSECNDPNECAFDPEMSGMTWGGGVLAGFNFELGDGFLLGVEGDWGWAGKIDNDDPIEATEMKIKDIATLRARAGYIFNDDTLFYATGGAAWVRTTFGGEVGDPNNPDRPFIDDTQWTSGWTIGGGIEHAFNEALHARLEYLYIDLNDEEYDLDVGTVNLNFEGIHLVRAGLTYNFGNLF